MKLEHQTSDPLDMVWLLGVDEGKELSGRLAYTLDYFQPSPDDTLIYFTTQSGEATKKIITSRKNRKKFGKG